MSGSHLLVIWYTYNELKMCWDHMQDLQSSTNPNQVLNNIFIDYYDLHQTA